MASLEELVFQGLGEASMCWSETPKGVFDSNRAKRIGDEIMQAIQDCQRCNRIEEEKNAAYTERNMCVALIARLAEMLGYKVGIKVDPNEEAGWQHIIFIDLPNGQLSWHIHDSELENFPGLPEYIAAWDGHTTEEKYQRIAAFLHSGE